MSQISFVINLPFCVPNKIDSFYGDFPWIIKLACRDGDKFEFAVNANTGFVSMGTFFLLVLSSAFILVTIWKHSPRDLSKALVASSAHITVVVLFSPHAYFCMCGLSPSHQLTNTCSLLILQSPLS
jgi:olfactory receptor